MPYRLLLLASVGLAGCVAPSVTLGASFGLARGHVPEDGRAFVRTRSALFVRLGAAFEGARISDPLEPAATETHVEPGMPASSAPACALAAACAWEQAQVAQADRHWRTP